MSHDLLPKVDRGDFQGLFIDDLNWLAPDVKQSITVTDDDGRQISAHNVASYKGLRVWVCDERPGSVLEAELDRLIAKTTTDRLVIFDDEKEQVWRWPVRRAKDGSVTSRLTSHRHKKGDADPKFVDRLDIIRMPFDVILDANAVLAKVRKAFDTEAQNESKRASKLMANMYATVEKAYPKTVDPKVRDHEISVTLARVLFLMFGDDTEMWNTDAFRNVIQHETLADGSNLAQVLNDLFTFLNTANPGTVPNGFAGFKYVNGGIFEEKIELPSLGKDFRTAILDACGVDWSTISPAIFGSMFQSVRDAATRRALGEHYTSEENILKTLEPLFLDELRQELAAALARETTQKKINALTKLWGRLGNIRFMDPACGCGNFIIVAYRELRALELEVMTAVADLRVAPGSSTLVADWTTLLKVTLDHFYGIEIDEWPARIAETAMFMMDRQCDLKLRERFGQAPERLPIQQEAKIVVGNALRLDWRQILPADETVVVAGNPPFHGHKERSTDETADLRLAWGTANTQHLDFVTGWYAKALEYFGSRTQGTWAFVSTNSVCQGEGVAQLFAPILGGGWRIRFAHRPFRWTSEATGAAAVHVVIVGFDRSTGSSAALYEAPGLDPLLVDNVSPYLVDGPNVLVTPRRNILSPSLEPLRAGSTPIDWGHLMVQAGDLSAVRNDPVASQFLRPYLGGKELINGLEAWCLWMDSPRVTAAHLRKSPLLKKRLDAVAAERARSGRAATRALAGTPHLFGERRQPTAAYLGIPQTFTDSREFATAARVSADTIASIKLFTHPDPDGFLFSIVSSTMFIVWQKTIGGRLKSDPSFSSSLVWNNFPVPAIDQTQRQAICAKGEEVLRVRSGFVGETLARLYNPGGMPTELRSAHQGLDREIDSAFGCSNGTLSLLERQEILFSRYEDLIAAEGRP